MIKIAVIGDEKVGKLSLNLRFSLNTKPDQKSLDYQLVFYNSTQLIDDKEIKLQIWPLNHVNRYVQQSFLFRNTLGVVICYAIDNRFSFNNVQKWINQVKLYSHDNIELILVGTKCDLEEQRQVSYYEGKQLANQLGILFFETSSEQDINVKEAFQSLTKNIMNNKYLQSEMTDSVKQGLQCEVKSYQRQFCYTS